MRVHVFAVTFALVSTPLFAQSQAPVVTAEDYARAERFLSRSTFPLVVGGTVRLAWISDDRAWYRATTADGSAFWLIDATNGSQRPAFDHAQLASALSAVADTTYDGTALPFTQIEFPSERELVFQVRQAQYVCDLDEYRCASPPASRVPPDRNVVMAPDSTRAAFIREHNLWVRDVATGVETQLTTDGIEDFGYATDNAGWTKSGRPVLVWSPDSKKIATFQHDARGVGDMYLVTTEIGHPELEAWKYPLPEDSVIFRISRVIIHVDARRVVRLQMPPDQHRSTICDHVRCGGTWADIDWAEDGSAVAFVSTSRDHKDEYVRIADAENGEVRDVFEEHVASFFESGYNAVNWRWLPKSNEFIWYSQRDNWGHLYLYDATTGELKHQVTSGDWNVLQLRRIDEEHRTLYFTGAGREPGDPYFQYFYRIGMDGSGLTLLTPDSANHSVRLSPNGAHMVDNYSTPTIPATAVLRDTDRGRVIAELSRADASQLVASGWQAPFPFTVKARDGKTDLYGLMYRPTNFDPSRKYPVINYIYPGPQSGSVGSRSFRPSRGDKQALAELGFIVVEVDAMGTPMRSKSYHAAYYGDMGDNGLPDQITMIEQLAARYPYMDLDHVGIYGHSGGGFAAADAIMRYPDFYHVAVSQAGNHDNRLYEDDWGEKWQGLLEEYEDGTTNYDNQANQLLAENLEGKLLIAHGTMDSNVPPYNTLAVVDALIAANKDFDLILFPNRRHGFGNEPYMMRRRWDYFVRHLLGAEPPVEYEFGQQRMLVP